MVCRFKEPRTHLVTWFSTFTWGTRRARKSLEDKVACISKGMNLLPQPSREHQHWTEARMVGNPHPPRPPEEGCLLLPTESWTQEEQKRGPSPATYLEPRWPRSTLLASFTSRSL